MKKRDVKSEIISIGMEMISLSGYNATGIDKILKKASVPKGSFYHYFGSKEDFGLSVIDNFADEYNQKLDSFLKDKNYSPLQRILNYLEQGIENMSENRFKKGCLIGNLGQELAAQNESFRARLEIIFNGWKEKFAACVDEAKKEGELDLDIDSETIAEFILSGWEGAILRAKVMQSPEPLRSFTDTLFSSVLKTKG